MRCPGAAWETGKQKRAAKKNSQLLLDKLYRSDGFVFVFFVFIFRMYKSASMTEKKKGVFFVLSF